MGHRVHRLTQPPGLVIVPRSRHIAVDFLQADQVGLLVSDDLDDALQAIAAIATTNSLMNVIAQNSHDHRSDD